MRDVPETLRIPSILGFCSQIGRICTDGEEQGPGVDPDVVKLGGHTTLDGFCKKYSANLWAPKLGAGLEGALAVEYLKYKRLAFC